MKTLKDREWFFSQEKIPVEVTNYDPHYNVYRLATTGHTVSEVEIKTGLDIEEPIVLGLCTDLHFNCCNNNDREDEELSYTEKCRYWPEKLKWFAPAINALFACDFTDQAIVLGDILDFMSEGAADVVKREVFKKYPEVLCAIGGHDYTKEMQTKIDDKLPIEERLDYIRAFWPHDIHYVSKDIKDKVIAVVLDNSRSKYLACQIEPLRREIERARREGKIIIICQHEPISSRNEAHVGIKSNIFNSGTLAAVNIGTDPNIIGGVNNCDEITSEIYDLITKNADVIKAIFAGHWHCQTYADVCASYEENGEVKDTTIPMYVISGNVYFSAGIIAKVIIK